MSACIRRARSSPGECAHIEAESGEHRLPVFDALRRMDEILVANFMLFHDVARDGCYDLWIGDEAWEVDHFLHENPELKSAPYAWLTDFVGYLPLPEGGEREALLTADYNAEMLEQVARYPERARPRDLRRRPRRRRGRQLRAGPARDPPVGRGALRVQRPHHRLRAADRGERAALRRELGWGEDEQICLVAVGGSGVGAALLQAVLAAAPEPPPAASPGCAWSASAARASTRARSTPARPSSTATSAICTAGSTPATSPSSRAG